MPSTLDPEPGEQGFQSTTTKSPHEILRIAYDLRFAISIAFEKNAISIPFPQRDLHFVTDACQQPLSR